MFAAIKAWIISLFHVHQWEEVRSGLVTHNGTPCGSYHDQRCAVCKKMRRFNLHS